MSIIFVVNSLKNKAGTERVAIFLANELSEKFNITIINRDCCKENSAFLISERINVLAFNGGVFSFAFQLRRYLKHNLPNLVVVHNMGKLSLLVALLTSNVRKWSYEHVARESRSYWINFLGRFLYGNYEKVFSITKKDSLAYLKNGIKTEIIYNPSPFKINKQYCNESTHILAIGRLTYQKGFDSLIKAWGLIKDKHPNWILDIFGEGEDRNKLLALIQKNNIQNIHILPPTDEIGEVYKKAAFYVMSSRYEGLPMVLIEAQSFSLPIVSFDCHFGPSEIITHEQDGLLVENQNINKLAEAMESLIVNPEKRMFFSKNASESAKRFSKEKIIAKWEDLLNKELSD